MHMTKEYWWRHGKSPSLVFLRTRLVQPEWALGVGDPLPTTVHNEELMTPPALAKSAPSGPVWPSLQGPGCGLEITSETPTCTSKSLVWWSLRANIQKRVKTKHPNFPFCASILEWTFPHLLQMAKPQDEFSWYHPTLASHWRQLPSVVQRLGGKCKTKAKQNKSLIFGGLYGLSFHHRPICLQDWILSDHFHGNSCGIRIGWRFRKSCWNSVLDQWGLFNYILELPWKRKFTNQAGFL